MAGLKQRRAHGRGVLVAAAALVCATPSLAQPPISRGQQSFPITYQECQNRAAAAFRALGWSNIGSSGNQTTGFKGIHSASIICNEGRDGAMFVNIFVASSNGDGSVPGEQRVQLQQAMNGAPVPPPRPPVVTPPPVVQTGPFQVQRLSATSVRVSWQGTQGHQRDWISIVPVGTPDSTHVNMWRYVNRTSGTEDFNDLKPGAYEARFYQDDNYVVIHRTRFNLP